MNFALAEWVDANCLSSIEGRLLRFEVPHLFYGIGEVVRRRILIGVGIVGFAVLSSGFLGHFTVPWSSGANAPINLDPQVRMNAENAQKIIDSENLESFALPNEEPPGLDYLTTIRTTRSAFEVWFQQEGGIYVICDGEHDGDSACDVETASILRDDQVDGRRVRVAQINLSPEEQEKLDRQPTEWSATDSVTHWKTVTLTRGAVPDWILALAQS